RVGPRVSGEHGADRPTVRGVHRWVRRADHGDPRRGFRLEPPATHPAAVLLGRPGRSSADPHGDACEPGAGTGERRTAGTPGSIEYSARFAVHFGAGEPV